MVAAVRVALPVAISGNMQKAGLEPDVVPGFLLQSAGVDPAVILTCFRIQVHAIPSGVKPDVISSRASLIITCENGALF